jgi:NAD+ kinase
MVSIGLTANPTNDKAVEIALGVQKMLKDRCDLFVADNISKQIGVDGKPLKDFRGDALVAVGGDGTLLWAAHEVNVPILGVKVGGVGFLAEVDPTEGPLDGAMERLLSGAYYVESRMMLTSEHGGHYPPDALNDIVVHVKDVAKMRSFELLVDRKSVGQLRADGIVISTPTGSTSYSLSTGGPCLDPSMDAIIVTGIAPFASSGRPLVVSPSKEVSVRLVGQEKETMLIVDGLYEEVLPPSSEIHCYRSPQRTTLIRFTSQFFQTLRAKAIIPWERA